MGEAYRWPGGPPPLPHLQLTLQLPRPLLPETSPPPGGWHCPRRRAAWVPRSRGVGVGVGGDRGEGRGRQ